MTETVSGSAAHDARPTLAFIGAGRAGSALAIALAEAGFAVIAVHSRTASHAASLASACGAAEAPTAIAAATAADITFLTVPDTQIPRVAATIAATGIALGARALVHCSATSGPAVMAAAAAGGAALGACHPLQALAGPSSAPLLRGTTFNVEAPEPLRTTLIRMVAALGGDALELPPGARPLYHAAAVLVGNAPLALLARATTLLAEAGVDRVVAHRALSALFAGAVRNAAASSPAVALTGPVVRGDAATVARHLEVLDGDPATRELYRRLALEILAVAGPDGREQVAAVLGDDQALQHSRPDPTGVVDHRVA